MQQIARSQLCSAHLVCYDRSGLPFAHTLRVVPLHAFDGSPRLFRLTSDAVTHNPYERPPSPEAPTGGCLSSSLFGAPPTPSPTGSLDSLGSPFPPSVPDGSVMVLNLPQPPYAIAWASPGWLALCGYSSLAEVLAYCASSSDVCPLHWGDTAPPPSAELLEEEYWGEEVESYFARWAPTEVGEALMAQEGARYH